MTDNSLPTSVKPKPSDTCGYLYPISIISPTLSRLMLPPLQQVGNSRLPHFFQVFPQQLTLV